MGPPPPGSTRQRPSSACEGGARMLGAAAGFEWRSLLLRLACGSAQHSTHCAAMQRGSEKLRQDCYTLRFAGKTWGHCGKETLTPGANEMHSQQQAGGKVRGRRRQCLQAPVPPTCRQPLGPRAGPAVTFSQMGGLSIDTGRAAEQSKTHRRTQGCPSHTNPRNVLRRSIHSWHCYSRLRSPTLFAPWHLCSKIPPRTALLTEILTALQLTAPAVADSTAAQTPLLRRPLSSC